MPTRHIPLQEITKNETFVFLDLPCKTASDFLGFCFNEVGVVGDIGDIHNIGDEHFNTTAAF